MPYMSVPMFVPQPIISSQLSREQSAPSFTGVHLCPSISADIFAFLNRLLSVREETVSKSCAIFANLSKLSASYESNWTDENYYEPQKSVLC